MPQSLMAYQTQMFSGHSSPASSRRSSEGFEVAPFAQPQYPPSNASYRGTWGPAANGEYPSASHSPNQHEYQRRLSLQQQGESWSRSTSGGNRRPSEPYHSSNGRSSAAYHTSSSWSSPSPEYTSPPLHPAVVPQYGTSHIPREEYVRPLAMSTVAEEPYEWNSGEVPSYPNSSAQDRSRGPPPMQGSLPFSPPLNVQIPPFDSESWNDMIFSAMGNSSSSSSSSAPYARPRASGVALNGYTFPHQISPNGSPSPSPSPDYQDSTTCSARPSPPLSGSSKSTPNPRKTSVDRSGVPKKCSHCQATSTPLWRREPTTLKPLCNACGLYLQQRNKLRPQALIDADTDDDSMEESDANYVGPECTHCRTHRTSVWRRSKSGEQLCNACGVYARLRGKPRPLSLKRNKIKPRTKHAAPPAK